MSGLQADGSRESLQELKGIQQAILADARAALAEDKARAAQAQELLRRETQIAKARAQGEAEVAAVRAKAEIESEARAKKRQESELATEKRKAEMAAKADARRKVADEKAAAKQTGDFYKAGGDALKSGADAALRAAEGLALASAAAVAAGVKFGVEATDYKKVNQEVLDKLTSGQGELAYKVSVDLSSKTGVDLKETISQVKELAQAGFDRAETEKLVAAAADLSTVKGKAAGEALLSGLEKSANLGKTTDRTIRALAGAGVEAADVYERLARKGETATEVAARVKAGQVEIGVFSAAVADSIESKYKGIAGHGLEAGLNRVKLGVHGLFDDFDISPLEDFGSKLDDILKSDSGGELKKSITEVGNAALSVIKDVSKDDIRHAFASASDTAHQLAGGIREASAAAGDLVKFAKDIGLIGEYADRVSGKHKIDLGGGTEGSYAVRPEEHEDSAKPTGEAISDGIAKGIADNASKVADAAKAAVRGGIDAGNKEAGIHSPSTVAAESGRYYDEGWEQGIDRHSDRPAKAAARLARGVADAGAASGGSVGSGASTGVGGASVSFTFAPVYQISVRSADDVVPTLRAREAADYARFLAQTRQSQRDAREVLTP